MTGKDRKGRPYECQVDVQTNNYERIAVNLSELLVQVCEAGDRDLHRLLSTAYLAAYKRAAEDTAQN